MNNLFNKIDVEGVLNRLDKLTPTSQPQWGKMNASQMLAHLNIALEIAMGKSFPKRVFIGRLIGRFAKAKVLSNPMKKNLPTSKEFIIVDTPDFEQQKAKAQELIKLFYEGGAEKCTTHPHPFFGKLIPKEWAILQWKHIDHHLRQFGV